jgi:hypothetical protein
LFDIGFACLPRLAWFLCICVDLFFTLLLDEECKYINGTNTKEKSLKRKKRKIVRKEIVGMKMLSFAIWHGDSAVMKYHTKSNHKENIGMYVCMLFLHSFPSLALVFFHHSIFFNQKDTTMKEYYC